VHIVTYSGTGYVKGPASPPGGTTYTPFPAKCERGAPDECRGFSISSRHYATASLFLKDTKGSRPGDAPFPLVDLAGSNRGLQQQPDDPVTVVNASAVVRAELSDADMVGVALPITFHWAPSSSSSSSTPGTPPNSATELVLSLPQQDTPFKTYGGQPYLLRVEGLGPRPAKGTPFKASPATPAAGQATWRASVAPGANSELCIWGRLVPAPAANPTA
jgi:hypothetical protein